MRSWQKKSQKKSLTRFIVLSVGLHLIWAAGVYVFDELNKKKSSEVVTIDFVPSQINPDLPTTPNLKNKKISPMPTQQIVEQNEKATNDETPEKTRFLSRNTQVVKKQTVSTNKGDFQNLKKNQASQAGNPDSQQEQKSKETKLTPKSKPSLKDLSPKLDALAVMNRQIEQEKEKTAGRGQRNADASASGQASQSPDYLKDVDQGLETMLSTKEFKYYTYFNRIRRQLSQHWEPKVRDKLNKMFKQGRSIASEEDKITKLVIILNKQGQLVKVQIMSASGVNDLDDAAVEAFQSAAPFPNPPGGIIDPDGTVKIRWDFVLES